MVGADGGWWVVSPAAIAVVAVAAGERDFVLEPTETSETSSFVLFSNFSLKVKFKNFILQTWSFVPDCYT